MCACVCVCVLCACVCVCANMFRFVCMCMVSWLPKTRPDPKHAPATEEAIRRATEEDLPQPTQKTKDEATHKRPAQDVTHANVFHGSGTAYNASTTYNSITYNAPIPPPLPKTRHAPTNAPIIPHFVDRKFIQTQVIGALLGTGTSQPVTVTSTPVTGTPPCNKSSTHIQGPGGVGKTAVASWTIHDEAVMRHFPLRFWVQLNQTPNLEAALKILYAEATSGGILQLRGKNERPPPSEDVVMARAQGKLRAVLKGKRCLLVIDDVWDSQHLKRFHGIIDEDAGARMLVTSRFSCLVEGSIDISVDKMTDSEANQVLCGGKPLVGKELKAVQEVRSLCRNHALAVSMAASMRNVYHMSWVKVSERLRNHKSKVKWADATYNTTYKGLMECIELSMEAMAPEQRERYDALAVLPEDVWMPQELLQLYWGLDEFDTREMVEQLRIRSLVEVNRTTTGEGTTCSIKPHDLQRDFLLSKAKTNATTQARLRRRHAALIGALQCEHVIGGQSYMWTPEQKLIVSTASPLAQYAGKHVVEHIQGAAGEPIPTTLPWKTFVMPGKTLVSEGVGCVRISHCCCYQIRCFSRRRWCGRPCPSAQGVEGAPVFESYK